jgi:hypothetical protein
MIMHYGLYFFGCTYYKILTTTSFQKSEYNSGVRINFWKHMKINLVIHDWKQAVNIKENKIFTNYAASKTKR